VDVEMSIQDERLWHYRARVLHVINGDTLIALVDKGMNDFSVMRFRLHGVDAPEVDPRVGSNEQRRVERLLGEQVRALLAERLEGHEVLLRTHMTKKSDKWLADIFVPPDTTSINQRLIEAGVAVRFGAQRPWRK